MRSFFSRFCPCVEQVRRNDVTEGANIPLTDEMSSARQESTDKDGRQDGVLLALTLDRAMFVVAAVVALSLCAGLPTHN